MLLRFSRNKKHHPEFVNQNNPAVTNIVTMFSMIAQMYKGLLTSAKTPFNFPILT